MNKSNTQLWKGQTERGNKTAGHFDIHIFTHEIAEDTPKQLFEDNTTMSVAMSDHNLVNIAH